MQPGSCKLLRFSPKVDLLVKEVRYGHVVKSDADGSHFLFYCNKLSYERQVIGLGNAKAAYLVV
jgi:hypothetical protein